VSSFFSSPSTQAPPPPVPTVDNSEALANAAKLEAERLRKRKGMKSTWLTGAEGADMGEQTQKATLLGG
jgi:hypothetical protein